MAKPDLSSDTVAARRSRPLEPPATDSAQGVPKADDLVPDHPDDGAAGDERGDQN